MDTFTHLAIGACIGELVAGKTLGKKALLIGAVAGALPDIDVITGVWMSPANGLLAHRGFTHSFLFAGTAAVLLALVASKWYVRFALPFKRWLLLFGLELLAHLFIDAFNAYGTGWFVPFSNYRVSFNAVFVADPFLSAGAGIAAIALLVVKRTHHKRRKWAGTGLALSAAYLLYCLANKYYTDTKVSNSLAREGIAYNRYLTTPVPMNSWLWYIVAESDSGFYIGHRSVFDHGDVLPLYYFPRNDTLLQQVHDRSALEQLIRFSGGYFTVERWHDTLVFNVLRFGQVIGWQNPHAHFVFHYYLNDASANRLVVQRGRFEDWNRQVARQLLKRICGNRPGGN